MSYGKDFESEVSKSVTQYLRDKTSWNYNSNTPAPVCDHMALVDGWAYLLEAKEVRSLKIPFSAVTENERKHLTRWIEADGLAAILIKYVATGGRSRVWWMPWGDWLQMEEEAGFETEVIKITCPGVGVHRERRKRGTASVSLADGQRPNWFRPIRKIDRVDSYGHSLGSCWDLSDIFRRGNHP